MRVLVRWMLIVDLPGSLLIGGIDRADFMPTMHRCGALLCSLAVVFRGAKLQPLFDFQHPYQQRCLITHSEMES
jgi:hypothetical protein